MVKSIIGTPKTRGRPPTTGKGLQIGMRWQDSELGAIDNWIAKSNEAIGRPEAVRRLVKLGLTIKSKARPRADSQKDRARELAGAAIDKMADVGASAEDKAVRKQRLIKEPSMVRDVRVDRKNK